MDGVNFLGHCLCLSSVQSYCHKGEFELLFVYLDPVLQESSFLDMSPAEDCLARKARHGAFRC